MLVLVAGFIPARVLLCARAYVRIRALYYTRGGGCVDDLVTVTSPIIMSQTRYRQLEPYSAPEWASGLAIVPKARIPVSSACLSLVKVACTRGVHSQLAMVPTPIHQWEVPGVPSPFSVTVKRDDLTHCTLTGNKVETELHTTNYVL